MVTNDIKTQQLWTHLAQTSGFKAEIFAKLCGVSVRQLRRHAQKKFGRSFQDWLNEQRQLTARHRLKETGCVKTVCAELGFKQVSHFSRQFKAYHGVSPREYIATAVNLKTFLKAKASAAGDESREEKEG